MQTRVEVELDVFSGRPNPTWSLSSDEADSFVKQLDQLPRMRTTKISGHLGYRGFIVRVTRAPDQQQSVRIQNGGVQISDGSTTSHAADADRQLERWLLETGKPHMKSDIFSMVQQSIR